MNQYKKLEVFFFKSATGDEPVRNWLLSFNKEDRIKIGEDILKVQYCWPIGKPLVDSLGNGLWEVRSKLVDTIVRVIFYINGKEMILLHSFTKKTQKTPLKEMELALKRKKLHEGKK